jgi:Fe-S cluster assembly iron-binding protein IscA
MALDESKEEDMAISEKGIDFVIAKDLYEEVKPIHVDFIETVRGSGFKVTANLPAATGCGGSCSC